MLRVLINLFSLALSLFLNCSLKHPILLLYLVLFLWMSSPPHFFSSVFTLPFLRLSLLPVTSVYLNLAYLCCVSALHRQALLQHCSFCSGSQFFISFSLARSFALSLSLLLSFSAFLCILYLGATQAPHINMSKSSYYLDKALYSFFFSLGWSINTLNFAPSPGKGAIHPIVTHAELPSTLIVLQLHLKLLL